MSDRKLNLAEISAVIKLIIGEMRLEEMDYYTEKLFEI